MSASQRNKGAVAEREFCGLIRDHLGVTMVRNLDQSRSGGYDLIPRGDQVGVVADALRGLAIEVKRRASATASDIAAWWEQATAQAMTRRLIPCLAYRIDRQAWRIVLPLSALHWALPCSDGYDFTAEYGIAAFSAVVREVLS